MTMQLPLISSWNRLTYLWLVKIMCQTPKCTSNLAGLRTTQDSRNHKMTRWTSHISSIGISHIPESQEDTEITEHFTPSPPNLHRNPRPTDPLSYPSDYIYRQPPRKQLRKGGRWFYLCYCMYETYVLFRHLWSMYVYAHPSLNFTISIPDSFPSIYLPPIRSRQFFHAFTLSCFPAHFFPPTRSHLFSSCPPIRNPIA
jgi:hypothetical protein